MTSTDDLTPRLVGVLEPALGAGTTVENLNPLTGGASRTTWAFDAVTCGQRRALILRTGPPDEVHAGMELEAHAQRAAAAAGAPVPHVVVADDSVAALGNPFLVCDAIAGETIVRRIQRQLDDTGRAQLLGQCAEAMVAIHRADADLPGISDDDQMAQWRHELDVIGDTTATFEWAFRWLADHRPTPSPPRLVHGDFRMGNLIVDGSDLAAVLDWELVHVGEVYEDLAWFCIRAWRFGAPAGLSAGGLGSIEDFLRAYEKSGGATIDRAAFHWWLVQATLRWGVICRYQAERHLSGQTPSVELATIGRRVCETEWDLLDLLDNAVAPPRDGQGAAGQVSATRQRQAAQRFGGARNLMTSAHGRPTAAELIAAVADFLETDVRQSTTGQVNFHSRVAANALRMVERELLADVDDGVADAVHAVGYGDEAQLAAAIRAGDVAGAGQPVQSALRALVGRRLAAAHPGYQDE